MVSRERNVLILYLSMYHDNYNKIYYSYKGEKAVDGIQTNEGTTKALIQHLEGKIDKIIYFATTTVRGTDFNNDKNQKHNERFRNTIEGYMKENGYCFDSDIFDEVEVNDSLDDKEMIAKIIDITEKLKPDDNVYIDLSGGQRQDAYTLLAISRILNIKGIELKAVFTTDFNNKKARDGKYTETSPLAIKDNQSVSQSMDYVNAINVFLDMGKVETLRDWFLNVRLTSEEEKILNELEAFYQSIRVCKVNQSIDKWKIVTGEIQNYRQSKNDRNCTKEFKFIVELLEKKMEQKYIHNEFNVIEWCLENGLLQQAITIFDEKIPQFILDKLNCNFKNSKMPKDNLLFNYPNTVDEKDKKSYEKIFDALLSGCNDKVGIALKAIYMLLDSVRDHANHASEDKKRNGIKRFLEKFYNEMSVCTLEWKEQENVGIMVKKYMYDVDKKKVSTITELMDNEEFIIEMIRFMLKLLGTGELEHIPKMEYLGSSNSIIVPITFSSKKQYKTFTKFNKDFSKKLKWNIFEIYKWRRVVSEVQDADRETTIHDAFGTNENETNERNYFYNEIFDLLYKTDQRVSALYIVSTDDNEFEFDNLIKDTSEKAIKIKGEDGRTIPIRKAYLYLTNVNSGILIVEMANMKETIGSELVNLEMSLENEALTVENQDLIQFFLGNAFKITLPFKQKRFVASYHWCSEEEELKETKYSLVSGGMFGSDRFIEFFSYYFQMFLICIIQKHEILKVSEMNKAICGLKDGKIRRRIDTIIMEYVKFQNRYDCIECTYVENGQKIYEKIRTTMNIESDYEKLGKQMETLQSLANVKLEKLQNWILFGVAILNILIMSKEYIIGFYSAFVRIILKWFNIISNLF